MHRLCALFFALGTAGLAGCAAPPPTGTGSGRVPQGWSTPAEAGDARILPDDYIAFSDAWTQALIAEMYDEPAFQGLPYRATILFGDIVNRTDIISSVEFEQVRERIKNNLMQSRDFRDRFRFLISRAQLDELRRREVNQPVDQQRFDEMHTYLLNGTMYRTSRTNTHSYLITYQLVNFRTGEIVFVRDFDDKRFGR
ncbi:MAG: hypothetical protein KF866_02475 [Phycisphaeraceae bacterium]|nr:hypothetical protein [Phycisphaeraceae bacterium]MCW5753440.1 hypothetical protein [Phycisphaeraceae bacterium]